jgi:hypothetical protein
MTADDRDRRIRELREAARDVKACSAERRAKALAKQREALLGPGAAELPMAPAHEPSKLQTRVASLFEEWNHRGRPAARVARMAEGIAGAAEAARAASGKAGRIGQTVRREAKRLLNMDDGALIVTFSSWDGLTEQQLSAKRYLDGAVTDAALELGLELTPLDGWTALRPALEAIAAGGVAWGRGAPEGKALSALAFDIACVFHELTGCEPGYSKGIDGPFSRFAKGLDGVMPVTAASERRMVAAVARWNRKERVRFI